MHLVSCWMYPGCADSVWWSSPEGQNEMVRDDDTHYGYGLSTCDVRVPIRTSPTGPCTPPLQSVVPMLESPLRNVNVRVYHPNSPSKFQLSSQTFFWCPRTSNFNWDYKCMECCGHTNIV